MRILKKYIAKSRVFFWRIVGSTFYEKKYLKGKWFENNDRGWYWIRMNFFSQKIRGINKHIPWTVSANITINGPATNLIFDMDSLDSFQGSGVYFQCFSATITIGSGTYIANNVGFITANHDFNNLDQHCPGENIMIGDDCWIGMNSVILPGVNVGNHTIVGAGSIVTKSFPEGHCVIAGNPAKEIKQLK